MSVLEPEKAQGFSGKSSAGKLECAGAKLLEERGIPSYLASLKTSLLLVVCERNCDQTL